MKLQQFKITTYCNISTDERNVVTLLYQPLIGVDAFSLYMTLWSLLDRKKLKSAKYYNSKLCDMLDITIDELFAARTRLEAIGLLDVYASEDNTRLLYELKAPLTAESFIKGATLGSYLYQKVGEQEFNDLTSMFRISKDVKEGFKNVTAHFDQVFNTIPEIIETDHDFYKKKKSKPKINHNFDYDLFLEGLSTDLIDKRKISLKTKETIINLSFIYQLDEITMQKACMDAANKDKVIDVKILSDSVKEWHSVMNKPIKKQSKKKFNKQAYIDVCRKSTPVEIIVNATGSKPTEAELKIIERLKNNYTIKNDLFNFLILYTLYAQKGQIPHYNYIEKIYVNWTRKGITTLEEAIDETYHFKKQNEEIISKKKNGYKPRRKSGDIEEEWLDEFKEYFE